MLVTFCDVRLICRWAMMGDLRLVVLRLRLCFKACDADCSVVPYCFVSFGLCCLKILVR